MYGLIGKKLGHSFSAEFFKEKFQREEIKETYRLFPLENINELPALLIEYPDLKGLNVTIPYKEEVIPYLNSISKEAAEIGAVNVLKIIKKDGKSYLQGYNTDWIGFKESLVPLLRSDVKKGLILGTGGASKAVAYVLKELGITPTFVSRTPANGRITYSDLSPEIISENLLIVNTTPLGMYPDVNKCPPLPYEYLTNKHICYDLIYNPLETKFLKISKSKGALVKNGLEMLESQAIASWHIWTNES